MNPRLSFPTMLSRSVLALAAIAIAATIPAARADRLIFMNGDRIPGKLLGGDDTGNILWQQAADTPALRIPTAKVHKIELAGTDDPVPVDQNVSIVMSNGDFVHGKLLSLDNAHLALTSPSFGNIEIPRFMIRDLNVNEGGYYLLSGAGNPKDWFVDRKGSWKIGGGSLKASDYGVLGRELPQASRIRMDFDVITEDSGAGFTIHLFATNKQMPAKESSYAIQFSGSYVYARKSMVTKEAGGLFGGGMNMNQESLGDPRRLDQAPGTKPLHITILGDARAGVLVLMINGKLMQTWNDPRGFGEKHGNAIGFASNNQSTEIRGLSVARWNGVAESAAGETDQASPADSIHTANDDVISGSVTGVKDGSLSIDSEHFGPMAVPTDRVMTVRLASLDREQARRMEGDVIANIRRGGRLTLKLLSLANDKLTGTSENTGKTSLAINSISELIFNLYTDKFPHPDNINTSNPAALLESDW